MAWAGEAIFVRRGVALGSPAAACQRWRARLPEALHAVRQEWTAALRFSWLAVVGKGQGCGVRTAPAKRHCGRATVIKRDSRFAGTPLPGWFRAYTRLRGSKALSIPCGILSPGINQGGGAAG